MNTVAANRSRLFVNLGRRLRSYDFAMPELPEVEHLKRSLEPALLEARVLSVNLRRRDVVRDCCGDKATSNRRGGVAPAHLLVGARISQLLRHGKNLIIVADTGRVICVHLGMSGSMRVTSHSSSLTPDSSPSQRQRRRGKSDDLTSELTHVHCIWELQTPRGDLLSLIFHDPRRFGGLWLYESYQSLHESRLKWLGPDALTMTAEALRAAIADSHRPIKAALLDQHVLAGVGNIYADEALFAAGIHPKRRASRLKGEEVAALATAIRRVLRRAVNAGGSTIRNYVDGHGQAGRFVELHQVYGCAGEPCQRCGCPLRCTTVAQRTTVFCPQCQPLRAVRQRR